MKLRINNYKLETPKVNKEIKIILISDLHNEVKKLELLLKIVKNQKPDYICISGDLIDKTNDNLESIISFVTSLANITKVIFTIGNHDIMKKVRGKTSEEINEHFYKSIETIDNCIFFKEHFSSFKIEKEKISFSGINMPLKWYRKYRENKKIFESSINEIEIDTLEKDYLNILLSHTPNPFIRKNKLVSSDKYKLLNRVDLILSGHNHAGLTPKWIQPFLNHYGLVGPFYKIIQPNSYGFWNNEDTSLLISDGIVKISKSSNLHIFDKFFLSDMEVIMVEPSKKHKLELINRKVVK